MHKDWCGKSCGDCKKPCRLDESIACSPDCEFLGENGEHNHPECQDCDALPLYRVPICYDGAVYVRASSPEEAREMVCDMTTDKMYEKSDGTWDIDEAERQEDE